MTLTPSCQICPISDGLLRCSGCKVARYCTKDHQVSDWSQHKSACGAIRTCHTRLNREEQKLRDQPEGDMFAPPRVFEEQAGHFWGLLHTRPYMRARYALVEATLKVVTYDAVVAALYHVMDVLRLNRSDNMGVRDLVPALLLRLDRDQESYDFVKWYATTGNDSDYDWGDMDEPYLDVKDADVLESPPVIMCRHFLDLNHVVSVILLKVKLLLALRAGSEGWEILRSSETFNQIEARRLQNATGDSNEEGHVEVIQVLKSQVDMLYKAVDDSSGYLWGAFIHPGRHLAARPEFSSHGSEEEMQLVLQHNYDAWKETPGAIDVIKAIREKKDY